MDAIILAGGLGTRLRPVISEVPKCMAPVCGKPFLHFLLTCLSQYKEIDHVALSIGYLKETVMDWIDKSAGNFPFAFDFAIEDTPLGTGGGIRLALQQTKSNDVLILNGDTFFNVNIREFYQFHSSHPAAISLALKPMQNFDRYGTVSVDETGIIQSFNEKQFRPSGLINGGVYLINTSLCSLNHLPEKFSFETEVLQAFVKKRNLYGFVEDSYFIDIGIPEDYAKANDHFKQLFPC
ncbi:D-mannose-1-phosphate guanyltransferase [Bacteroidia bacterium]|nr:D-mannose-1-phosphate guanyltransferase [Bacteroidia bacterium]